ncbi:hypothetical protein C8A05DRAFT_34406 [Staphylotrichum tortipilum]|uniref:Uncharacterized protein n=1 Tax=Staphylotrichum tortipilum TaxID=2831512 RepID=A0AAN6MKV8_9PEZI|nr:hypothetical protein C8A05DRAFT_34406 [Staphylotrichum longicolle]
MAVYPWIKTSDKTYEQQYGFMERFFTRFLGEEGVPSQFTIMATVEFRVAGAQSDDLESRLRKTWRAMRYNSPSVAALSGPKGKIYRIPNDVALADWETTTFKRHPPGTTAEKLFGSIDRAALITLHFLPGAGNAPDAHQIVLQAEHQNIDGRGVFYLIHRFWTVFTTPSLLSTPPFGDEWTRLPPAMDDLLSLPAQPSPADHSLAAEWIAPLASVTPLGILIPASHSPTQLPTTSLRALLRLSQLETAALIAACKAHSLTVTSAWVAALALALAAAQTTSGQPLPADAALVSFATCDMRRYFPHATFDPTSAPVACYHAAIPTALRIDGGKASFLDLAAEMKHEFHGGSVTAARGRAWAPFVGLMGDVVVAAATAAGSGNARRSAPLISSLGVVDDFVEKSYDGEGGEVEVLDVWIADTMMSSTNLWMLHTWDGMLNLSVTYNEAYFPVGLMEGVLERIWEELRSGLGLVL